MNFQFSLAHLTILGCSPAEITYIAARTGYDFVSLRLIPMGVNGEHSFTLEDRQAVAETRTALKETGIRLLDIELTRIVRNIDPKTYLPAFEIAAEFGACHVIASVWTTEQNDRDFIVERYGEICDLAQPFGLTVDLEFPSFSRLANLRQATDIIQEAGRKNGGLLLDTLYYHFTHMTPDELLTIPADWIHFLHICDAPEHIPAATEDLKAIARGNRLYIGHGCLDFKAICSNLPLVPLSIELPNVAQIAALGYEGHARRCLETAREHLHGLFRSTC